MRPLVIILLLVFAAACYSSGAEDRGVVIDGYCPADFDPVTVGPAYRNPRWGEGYDWELIGSAHGGRIALEWSDPPYSDIIGYVIARHSYDMQEYMEHGSVRTFVAADDPNTRRYFDTTDIEPRTRYQYRVFPVTGDGLGFPSWPLVIWSLPAERPDAPLTATIKDYGDRRALRAAHSFLKPATDALVLRRGSADEQWQVVHEPRIRDRDWWSPTEGDFVFVDEESEPGVDYEYAICYANRAGVGRATLLNAGSGLDSETVPVDPPQDIKGVANDTILTVYWIPSSDPKVRGYGVQRQQVDEDDVGGLQSETIDQAMSFQRFSIGRLPDVPQHKFRVRAITDEGQGPWSEWFAVDLSSRAESQVSTPKPEILASGATNERVHLAWHVDGSLEGLQVRYLRRRSATDDEFKAYQYWDWIDSNEYNWDHAYPIESTAWIDDHDVRPDTAYEYAVQLKRGDVVGPASDPVSVRTSTNPDIVERRPLAVLDFEAEPTSDGVRLTWILPADTTLEGLLVRETRVDNGHPGSFPPMVLPSYQTEYLALTRGYSPGASHYSFDVETFNDFGTQAVGFQREYVYPTEMMHCTATTEELLWRNREQVTIRFRACEETLTQVVRRELTADGFEVSTFRQPCVWAQTEVNPNQYGSDELEGTLTCQYDDTGVKPGTWYVYELTQTLEDGRMFTSHHEVVTRPLYVAP